MPLSRAIATSLLAALVTAAFVQLGPAQAGQGVAPPAVCFTPGEDCTGLIIREIKAAQKSVLVQAYSFTSAPIARELAEAHRRGLDVEVILDKSNRTERYSAADFIAHDGIPVRIDAEHRIAHNKVMVIDGETVITGSFNFTRAAQLDNAENVLVLHDPAIAARYAENWRRHWGHSEPYRGRDDH